MTHTRLWNPVLVASLVFGFLASSCGGVTPSPTPTPPPASPPAQPTAASRCGDGVCDDAERANASLCPQDCPAPTDSPPTAPAPTVGAPPTSPPASKPAGPPNIVMILTDDLDEAGLPYMSRMNALITDLGTTLPNFLISTPLCCPSRATILRGQYAHNTQIQGNDMPFGGFPKFIELNEEESTVATWLEDAGYRTMLAGKYLNAFPLEDDMLHIPPGWTEWFSPMAGEAYIQYDYTLNENGLAVVYGNEPDDYGTDVYLRNTLAFIQRSSQSGQPFFAHVCVYAPHWPTTAAARHEGMYNDVQAPRTPNYDEEDVSDKPAYISGLPRLSQGDIVRIDEEFRKRLRAMEAVDEMVEAVVEALRLTGQLDNTYVFFTSDNGYHQGNHRQLLGKGAPYEEDLRVGLMVRGPGVPAGATLEHLATNTDLAPTWADLAGAQTPAFVDGRSLVPLLRPNPPSVEQWRQALLIEHAPWALPGASRQPAGSATNTPQSLLEPPDPDAERQAPSSASPTGAQVPPYRGIRTERYVYIEYPTGESELYDLQQDPYQLQNIASTARPELVRELALRLQELHGCSGAECREIEDQPFTQW
jgi:N-acetylglucosamine-6-sulfatase